MTTNVHMCPLTYHQAPCHPSQPPYLTFCRTLLESLEVYRCGVPCDHDPDLAVHMYPACKCDLDHSWPRLQVSLIVHSFLFIQQVFIPERDCSGDYCNE